MVHAITSHGPLPFCPPRHGFSTYLFFPLFTALHALIVTRLMHPLMCYESASLSRGTSLSLHPQPAQPMSLDREGFHLPTAGCVQRSQHGAHVVEGERRRRQQHAQQARTLQAATRSAPEPLPDSKIRKGPPTVPAASASAGYHYTSTAANEHTAFIRYASGIARTCTAGSHLCPAALRAAGVSHQTKLRSNVKLSRSVTALRSALCALTACRPAACCWPRAPRRAGATRTAS